MRRDKRGHTTGVCWMTLLLTLCFIVVDFHTLSTVLCANFFSFYSRVTAKTDDLVVVFEDYIIYLCITTKALQWNMHLNCCD